MSPLRKHLKVQPYHKFTTDFQLIAIGKRTKKYFSEGIQTFKIMPKKLTILLIGLLVSITTTQAQTWTQIGADIDGEADGDYSGSSVSLSADGSVVAIGAYGNEENGSLAGHVRIYQNQSGTWTQIGADIDGEAALDNSGRSVSLSSDGSVVAIGAPYNDGNGTDAGHVRIYQNQSGTWTRIGGDIDGEAAGDNSGYSVSLSSDGSVVAIGALYNDGNGFASGHVRIYQNQSGTWVQIGADIDGEAYDVSGCSVSLSADGSVVAIGAYGNDGNGTDAGQVRIYQNQSGTWTQIGGDINGEAASDNSGWSVSLSADGLVLAIGAHYNDGNGADACGHVRIYQYVSGTWAQIGGDIDGEVANDWSGWSVSLSANGSVVAIGAIHNDASGTDAGHVRIYQNQSGTWVQIGADIDGEAAEDNSGHSVSLSADGSVVAIGACLNDGNGADAGQARLYRLLQMPVITSQPANQSNVCPGDSISFSVAANGASAYQWQESINGGVNFTDIVNGGVYSNATTATLNIAGVMLSMNNYGYRCVISNEYGSVTSDTATLTNDYEKPTITSTHNDQQIVADTVCQASLPDYTGDVTATDNCDTLLDVTQTPAAGTTISGSTNTVTLRVTDDSGNFDEVSFNVAVLCDTHPQIGADIDGEAANDWSGRSVSLSADGSVVAIGADSNDGNGVFAGHVRIYQNQSGTWVQMGADIDGEAASDNSGNSVSLSANGSVVAIGAYGNDGNGTDAGHVRIYQNQSGTWVQIGGDIDGEAAGDYSGNSVSLSTDGSVVAIGAYGNDGNGTDAGHVRIYQNQGGTWVQIGGDIDGEAADDCSGYSVSLSADGSVVAIGALYNDGNGTDAGHVRIYQNQSGTWTQIGADIDGEAAYDYSGCSVSLSADGSVVAIGAVYNDGNGTDAGHVRIYQNQSGTWTQIGADIDGEAAGDRSGYSVSLSADGSVVAIGAPWNDGNGTEIGHVRIYQNQSGTWTQIGGDIDGEAAGDESGYSVSLSADSSVVAIGARLNDNVNGIDAGHVRVYGLLQLPGITSQPTNQSNVCPGDSISFSVTANFATAYQWQESIDGGTNFTDIVNGGVYSNATTATLNIAGVTLSMNNYGYRCVISNEYGSVTSDTATLTTDYEKPTITSTHNDQQIVADTLCQASLPDYTGNVTATDNCDILLEVTQTPAAGTTIFGSTNTVTLRVTDDSGNFDEVSFNVAVVDNTNPTISCITNKTVNADSLHTYTVQGTEFDPTATNDNCGVDSVVNNFNNTSTLAGAKLPEGTTTIVWTVTDNAGNSSSCSFDVLVNAWVGNKTWAQIGGDIDGEAADDWSGCSVSLSADGSVVAIGAHNNDGNGTDAGHVRIYQNLSGTWVQIGGDIDGEAADDRSGWSVSLSADGSVVAIGAWGNDGNGTSAGHVRIYQNQSGTWVQIGADIDGEATGDYSGWSVSLSADGSVVAIGAPYNDGNGSGAGHVRIYQNQSGTWVQIGADIDGEAADDYSGYSVSLSADGSVVAIGAYCNDGNGTNVGHVRIYQNQSGTWVQIGTDIDGEAADDWSSMSVSLSANGSVVAIGAEGNDGNGTNAGHVRIYQNQSGTWTKIGADIDGEAADDQSGTSVSLSADGSVVAIGAIYNDGNGTDAGHVRIYQNQSGTWTQIGADIDGEAAYDYSGCSVSLSDYGSVVAIGAHFNDGNGANACGHVRVYGLLQLPGITSQPANQSNVCPGDSISFSVTANGATAYQWQKSIDGGTIFTDIVNDSVYSNATTATLNIAGVTLGMNNYRYRCVISNAEGSVTSNTATLTTDYEKPTITSTHNDQQIVADTVCQASLPDYTGDLTATDNCDTSPDITQTPAAGTTIFGSTNTVTLRVTDDSGNFDEVSFNVAVVCDTYPTITSFTPSSGKVGSLVTINGTNFGSMQGTVMFGGVDATLRSWNDTKIEVTVPNLPEGGYIISVITYTDETASSTSQFMVSGRCPTPTIRKKGSINILICQTPNAYSYQWYLNDNEVIGATKQFYVARNKYGRYSVQVVESNGCDMRSAEIAIFSSSKVAVYPNPTNTDFNIVLDFEQTGQTTIKLVNPSGNIKQLFTINKEMSSQTIPMNINNLEKGIYFIEVEVNGEKIETQKVVIF